MALNLHVQLDVDYQDDPKIIRAGHIGETLYLRSLARVKRLMSDGVIHREQLASLAIGLPGRPATIARKLVDVGLWKTHRDGWQITAWQKRNQSANAIKAKVSRRKLSAIKANHQRWHTGENGKPNDECPLCYPDDDPNSIRTGSDSESTKENPVPPEEEPEEEPEHPSRRKSSSVLTVVPDHPDDHDDLFESTIEAIVDAKALIWPPRRMRTWRPVTKSNTIDEDGDLVRRMIADGTPTDHIVLFVLGHGDSTADKRARAPIHDPDCTDCDDGFVGTIDESGTTRYAACPNTMTETGAANR